MIRGVGPTLENDGASSLVRGKVEDLASALATKYGKPEQEDYCVGSDVSCESRFWMMTLNDNERSYGYRWEGGEKLKAANLASIALAAQANSINSSYVIVEYRGANKTACDAAIKASSAAAMVARYWR